MNLAIMNSSNILNNRHKKGISKILEIDVSKSFLVNVESELNLK
jgi:hypothetical protein